MATNTEPTTGDSMDSKDYDYDLIVIGGGSGGIALAREAAKFEKRVAMLDFVKPTVHGSTWGLGGTCVNVGCIPKKLMHQAALIGQAMKDSEKFGYTVEPSFAWETCIQSIRDYIGSLNFGYRTTMREENVKYINAYGSLLDRHRVKCVNKRGEENIISGLRICIATGGRPRVPDVPGKDLCITSDDLFLRRTAPGKTLVIGASYVALECAGFLAGMGYDVTVMVRSILLRGFDQEMATKIGENMETYHNIKFLRGFVPQEFTNELEGDTKRIRVNATGSGSNAGQAHSDVFDTVLVATGRDPCTSGIGLDTVGVKLDDKGFILSDNEKTNVWSIYGIGDALSGKPELTPTAIQAGRLLARRLYGESTLACDYENVATTVFTPLEYGCCGLSEEDAIARHGEDNVEVYHDHVLPLELVIPRSEEFGFVKVITLKPEERVIGFHILAPNAGEITQGYGVAMKCGLTKEQLDAAIGIHPTCAENPTTMATTKRSGKELKSGGC
ncbi:thioredoxin reductase 1, cytoplasmic-like isoform X2 [Sycon ciliatum]|uniref:thioredoxin reductase 1, cytoplasmic-like isoform X2 n=1 Tax=Sycon ciliatum TaxID=27933 RepID=UPI0020A8E6EB